MAIDNYPLATSTDETGGVRTLNVLPDVFRRRGRWSDRRDAAETATLTIADEAPESVDLTSPEADHTTRDVREILPTQREPGSGPFGPDDQWDVMHREEFIELLDERLQNREPVALITFGMDRFGEVNHEFGLAAGDSALRNAYRVLRWMLGPSNVSYFGSDGYAALLPYTDDQTVVDMVQKALDRMERVDLSDHLTGVFATTSAGIVVLDGTDTSADEALYEAECALMAAKSKGGNRLEMVQVWPPVNSGNDTVSA